MFEKRIQKILNQLVGKIVDVDIAKLKVGLTSGELVARNINLKPGVLERLGLPLKVKLSLVHKLTLTIPWKVFRDKPITITFEGVHALAEPSSWTNDELKESRDFSKNLKFLDFLTEFFSIKIVDEESEKKKQKRYKKLYVVDNIQLCIKDLHLRVENPDNRNALGLTLEELHVYTVNAEGMHAYVKRDLTNPEPLRKRITVRNLGLYCYDTGDNNSFGRQDPYDIRLNMRNFLFGSFPKAGSIEYIVKVSGICQVTIKSSRSLVVDETPKTQLKIEIPTLDFRVKKYQFDSFMVLIEFITTEILAFNKPAEKEVVDEEIIRMGTEEKLNEFKRLYEIIYKDKNPKKKKKLKKKIKERFEESELKRFKTLLEKMSPDAIALGVKQVIARQEPVKNGAKEHCEHCLGFFSSKHRPKKEEHIPDHLDPEDIKIIETAHKKVFHHDGRKEKAELPLKNKFALTLDIEHGSLYLFDVRGESGEEFGILLSYDGINVNTFATTRGNRINASLQEFAIRLKNLEKQEVFIVRKIFCPISMNQSKFLTIHIEEKLEGKDQENRILVDARGIELIYRMSALRFLVDFFTIRIKNKAQKNKSIPKLEIPSEGRELSYSTTTKPVNRFNFTINMTTLMFLIPFSKDNENEDERNGILISISVIDVNGKAMDIKDVKSSQNVKTSLKDLKVYYFPNKEFYYKLLHTFIKQEKDGYQLQPDDHDKWEIFEQPEMTAETEITCKRKFLEVMRREFEINVNVNMPKLILVMKSRLYRKMISMLPHADELIKLLIKIIPPQKSKKVENKALKVNVEIESMNVIMPVPPLKANRSDRMLIFEGSMSLSMTTPRMPGIKRTLTVLRESSLAVLMDDHPGEGHFDIPFKSKVDVVLKQGQLYICLAESYTSDAFFTIKHRKNIILPFEMYMTRSLRTIKHAHKPGYLPLTSTQINLQNLVVKTSVQDSLIMGISLEYQLKQLIEGFDECMQRGFMKRNPLKPKKRDTSKPRKDVLEDLKVQGNGIQIFFIDDVDEVRAPCLKITLLDLNLELDVEYQNTKLETGFYLTACYFNPVPARWEPFIEESGVDFAFSMEGDLKTNIYITNKKDTKVINLTVSDQMISTLYPIFLNMGKPDQEKLALDFSKTTVLGKGIEERVIHRTSPYIIINETGYPIQIDTMFTCVTQNLETGWKNSSVLEESFYVENMGACSCLIEPNTGFVFERGTHDTFVVPNRIKVKILHPRDQIDSIENLRIDKIGTRKYHVKGVSDYSTNKEEADYYVSCIIETHKSKKIITLTSSISFINKFCKPCRLIFESHEQKVETRLDINETARVPIDFIYGTLSVIPETCDVVPESAFLQELIDHESRDYHLHEFQSGSTFVVARSAITDDTPKTYNIALLAPFEMKNCCGLELFYRMRVQGEKCSEDYKILKPQETMHDTSISLNLPIYIQVKLQGYNWCEEVLVSLSNEKTDRIVEINMGSTAKTSYVRMFIPKGESRRRKILLYTGACIVNETPFNFYYDFISKDRNEPQLPGSKLKEEEGQCSSKITLANDMKAMILSRPESKEQSDIVYVATVGITTAELYNEAETSLLELGIKVTSLHCDKDYNLTTKIITISPRYVLINMTDYDLEIKREFGKTLAVLKKEVRTPLYWSDWEPLLKEKKISMRYREADKNEDFWEWSNSFSIKDPGIYDCMMLPSNGEQTQMKFFKITVNLVTPTIFVVIEEDQVAKEPPIPGLDTGVMNLQLICSRLGLSVVSTVTDARKKVKEPKELAYILFTEVHFAMREDSQNRTYQAKLEHLNVDNNACYDTSYPVLWTPARPYVHGLKNQSRFLELTISQRKLSKVTSYDNIEINLGSSTLKVDSQLRNVIKETISNIMERLNHESHLRTEKKQTIAQTIFKSQKSAIRIQDDEDFADEYGWMKVELSKAIFKTVFIRKLFFKAVSLNIFSLLDENDTQEDIYELLHLAVREKRKKRTKGMSSLHKAMRWLSRKDPYTEDSAFLRDVAGAIGQFLSRLDNLTLDLTDVSLENEFDSPDAIGNKIARKYISKAGKTILKIMQGLGKSAITRIFNKVSSRAEIIKDEVKAQRQKSLRRREKRIKAATEPNTKPAEGEIEDQKTEEDPSIDLAKKPLMGDTDNLEDNPNQTVIERVTNAVADFVERGKGVDSASTDIMQIFGVKPKEIRKRLPRAFYGECQTYKTYSDIDAEALWRLYFSLGEEFEGLSHIKAFDGFHNQNGYDEKESYLLILSSEIVIWYHVHGDSVKWAIVPSDIESVETVENGLEIQLKEVPKYLEDKTLRIRTLDKVKDEYVRQTLISLMDPLHPQESV